MNLVHLTIQVRLWLYGQGVFLVQNLYSESDSVSLRERPPEIISLKASSADILSSFMSLFSKKTRNPELGFGEVGTKTGILAKSLESRG